MIRDRRAGRFVIAHSLINGYPEVVKEIMKDLIVVRALDCNYFRGIEYVAIGTPFKEVPDGQLVPRYEPEFWREGDQMIFRGWREIE